MLKFLTFTCSLWVLSLSPSWGEQASAQALSADALPSDVKERDDELKLYWNTLIPVLAGMMPYNTLVSAFANFEWLSTPFPHNPYRAPGIDKSFIFPANAEEWLHILNECNTKKQQHTYLISLMDYFLFSPAPGTSQGSEVTLRVFDPQKTRYLFQRPSQYDVAVFSKHFSILNDSTNSNISLTIGLPQLQEFKRFKEYHTKQVEKIVALEQVMTKAGNPDFFFKALSSKDSPYHIQAKNYLEELRPFFLSPRLPVPKIINVEPLQARDRGDAEVIVYDVDLGVSKRINYSKAQQESDKEVTQAGSSHGAGAASIVAGRDDLAHLKGIAPGAQVIQINEINQETLEKIRRSKARVINISRNHTTTQACYQYFQERDNERLTQTTTGLSYATNKTTIPDPAENEFHNCRNLYDLVDVIEEKDMAVVMAAGNEALQLEEIDWQTGLIKEDLTNSVLGQQYQRFSQNTFNGYYISINNMWRQIPRLKDRFIQVGNLLPDGVTIASSSSLPGAFPESFIFAPGDQVTALYASPLPAGASTTRAFYGELGHFVGTSSAAPRVTGVMVLLGKLFPDLPMTTIRNCALSTGTPFWQDPRNKFELWKPIATTDYGKRIYGQGLINAMAAYEKCQDESTLKKNTAVSISGLDLTPPQYRDTSIVTALIKGDEKAVKAYYAKHSAEQKLLNADNKEVMLPLEIALAHNHYTIAEFLLDNTNIEPQPATTMITMLVGKSLDGMDFPLSLAEKLVQKGGLAEEAIKQSKVKLFDALALDNLNLAKFLLNNKHVGSWLEDGHGLLSSAVISENIEMVRLLLEHPYSFNFFSNEKHVIDSYGTGPLHSTAAHRSPEILNLLFQYPQMKKALLSKDVIKDYQGRSPLHQAALAGNIVIIQALLNDPESRAALLNDEAWMDDEGQIPLSYVRPGDEEIGNILQQAKAEFDK